MKDRERGNREKERVFFTNAFKIILIILPYEILILILREKRAREVFLPCNANFNSM